MWIKVEKRILDKKAYSKRESLENDKRRSENEKVIKLKALCSLGRIDINMLIGCKHNF